METTRNGEERVSRSMSLAGPSEKHLVQVQKVDGRGTTLGRQFVLCPWYLDCCPRTYSGKFGKSVGEDQVSWELMRAIASEESGEEALRK